MKLILILFSLILSPVIASGADMPAITRHHSLKALSSQDALTLRGTEGSSTIDFGSRLDEIVTHAVLHLHYTYSPALIPLQSHIKVRLNDQIVAVLPITKENAGRNIESDIVLDPALFTDFNRLQLQLIGHYTANCEDPLNSSLWTEVGGASDLEITSTPVSLGNDLSMLPVPFFDKRDSSELRLPFIFPANPDKTILNASGIVASWFGKLAAWRGARFTAHFDTPAGDAVVFATNSERPPFLQNHPKVNAPTLEIMTNPVDGYSKLLLVLGRDGNDLITAARALVLGNAALSGAQATIRSVADEKARQAYDAPNWVRMDRPMKFGEMVASPQDLQVKSHFSAPIRINMMIPPDFFTWHKKGVPVNLKFSYTAPIVQSESRMVMSLNDELVKSFTLQASGHNTESAKLRLPLLDDLIFKESREVFLPAYKLGARNQLQFNFSFAYLKSGQCTGAITENVRGMIDPDSTIDFSGLPHYAEMPNLRYFTTAGFPFTKYADLSQTIVVIPDAPSVYDIETMLTLLGRMGEATGYPATRVRVAGPGDRLDDADLLVIGAAPQLGLLTRWNKYLPAIISGAKREISQPTKTVNAFYHWLGLAPDPDVFSQEKLDAGGPLAAILGFESPVTSGRSVVAITASAPEDLVLPLNALEKPNLSNEVKGSVAMIHPHKIESYLVGNTYFVGHLPVLTAIWYTLSKYPVLMAVLALLALIFLAFALARGFKAIEARRLDGKS